ncbi:MAG: CPBP family intramembrane glutamic endopeptidase [Nitriliruptorales bacterium]
MLTQRHQVTRTHSSDYPDPPVIPAPPWDRRRERAIELAVFLFLIVPSMLLSFFAAQEGQLPFALLAASTMARDLSLVALIVFFMGRNREPVAAIGWQARRLGREVMLGVALFPLLFFASTTVNIALRAAGFSGPSSPQPDLVPAPDPGQLVLAVVLVVVVAVSEETIFRGYLMRRIEELSASPAWAIVLSAAIFSLGHGYEGSAGVITVGLSGVVLGVVYWWRRSIVAPVVMHFLLDLAAIVAIPVLLR